MSTSRAYWTRSPAVAASLCAAAMLLFPAVGRSQTFRGGGRGGMGQRSGFGGGGILRGGQVGSVPSQGFGGRSAFQGQAAPSSFGQPNFPPAQGATIFQQPQMLSRQPVQASDNAGQRRSLRQNLLGAVPSNGITHSTMRPVLPRNDMRSPTRVLSNFVPGLADSTAVEPDSGGCQVPGWHPARKHPGL